MFNNSKANTVFLLILLQLYVLFESIDSQTTVKNKTVVPKEDPIEIKCYTNISFRTGLPEYCEKPKPFCCFDIFGDYYCCEEEQLLTILTASSIIFSVVLFWILLISGSLALFVDFDVEKPVMFTPEKAEDDAFSHVFDSTDKKDEKKDEKKDDKKEEKEQIKPPQSKIRSPLNESPKKKSNEEYKPAWGQFDQQSPTADKRGFKPKSVKSKASVSSLKATVNKPSSQSQSKEVKQTKSQNFNENVEKFKLTLNK